MKFRNFTQEQQTFHGIENVHRTSIKMFLSKCSSHCSIPLDSIVYSVFQLLQSKGLAILVVICLLTIKFRGSHRTTTFVQAIVHAVDLQASPQRRESRQDMIGHIWIQTRDPSPPDILASQHLHSLQLARLDNQSPSSLAPEAGLTPGARGRAM